MSAVISGTKKKMAVSADQFEDADEETEDFTPEKPTPPKSDAPAKEASPTVKREPEDPDSSASDEKKEPDAPPPKEEEAEETKGKTEELSETEEHPASTSPTPNKGSDSPLDALALACVAAEQPKKKKKLPDPKPPKQGTRARAEEISCTDVLCGRGGQSNHHPGNIFFRRLVRAKQEEYLKANKREKTLVAKDIVKLIRMLNPPGRFLKKDSKDENFYVDVGDVQARNKASQALREGAPELREELRDQHSRLNAQNGGGPEVKLPYHGHKGSAVSQEERAEEARKLMMLKEREALAARAAAAQGLMLPPFGAVPEAMGVPPALRGQADPPEGSDEETEPSSKAAVSAAAMHAAAEERARRLMLAGGAPPGLGAHMGLGGHPLGLAGLGGPHMNPFLAGPHSQAAQFAALQAASGPHLLSQQALMMAAAAHQQPSAAAALFQAQRARELALSEYAAAAGAGFLGGQGRGMHAQAQLQEQMRLHELMAANGGAGATAGPGSKREREEIEREIEEKYSKAAKLGRQYM